RRRPRQAARGSGGARRSGARAAGTFGGRADRRVVGTAAEVARDGRSADRAEAGGAAAASGRADVTATTAATARSTTARVATTPPARTATTRAGAATAAGARPTARAEHVTVRHVRGHRRVADADGVLVGRIARRDVAHRRLLRVRRIAGARIGRPRR